MARNHELFLTLLLKVCLFAFPFMAFELVFTRFISFGVATGCAAFLAAVIGATLDHLLLRAEPQPVPELVEPAPEKVPKKAAPSPSVADIHASPLVEAYRVDLAQAKAEVKRADRRLRVKEQENGDLRLQLIESESKQLASTEAPFPVGDDVLQLGYHGAVDDFKRRILTESISQTNGNRAEAARQLGLQRTYLYRLVKQFQVKA